MKKHKRYPKFQELTHEDFNGVVPYGLLEELLTPTKLKQLYKWLDGQTQSIHGPYFYDVHRWLWSQQKRKRNPVIYD